MKKQRLLLMFFSQALLLCCSAALSWAFTLPDTGQTKCYNTAGAEISCAGTGQDGAYIINPMSYTDNGNGTITDNVTGLMWQKGNNATTYNWYQASGTYDATYNPSSLNVCGSLGLAGQSDWRLPTKKELITLVDYSIPYPGPTINATYFPNTQATGYWSSTTYVHSTDYAWPVGFATGGVGYEYKPIQYFYVRCVRGGQTTPSFTNNGNGTVTDNGTGLMWQKGEVGIMTWADALTYCESLSLGGQTDWRLPNIKELESITDDTKYNPAIDITYFPNATADRYWSSTTLASSTRLAWCVSFYYGGVSNDNKDNYYLYYFPVRCVRAGQPGSLCNLTISPSSQTFTSSGGTGSVIVTASGSSCAWSVTNNLSWVTITSGSSGTGSGTVTISVSANTTGASRTGNITIAGQTFTITQAAACTYTISPTSQSFTSTGGTGSVTVTASGSSCAWSVTNNLSWVTITSGSSGTGSGTVTISVSANTTGASRTGNITIAGQTFTITQAAACTYTISPTSQSFTSTGGTGSVTITASASSCAWTASSLLSWATITSGSSGTGSGTVNYSVSVNSGASSRTGNITIAGQTFTITQAAACTYTISPTSQSFTSTGGTGSINVTTQTNCGWGATASDTWITISSPGTLGTINSGTVSYSVSNNTTGSARAGTITVFDVTNNSISQTFTITQSDRVFADVAPTNVFYSYINAIYNAGITVGCSQNPLMYCPDDSVTRGQMAAFIIRAKYGENFAYTQTPYFSDVPATNGFFKYVQKMKDNAITVVTGTYGVNDVVTRGQMAAFIIRAKYGETFTYTQTPYFSDVPATNGFFKYVQMMKDTGITTVTGTYGVNDTVTRGQMAAFIARAFLNIP